MYEKKDKKIISSLLALGIVSGSLTIFSPLKVVSATEKTTVSTEKNIKEEFNKGETEMGVVTPMTAYNWWVYNLGVNPMGVSQIMGPMSGGSFNTEGVLGANRTFTISWSGASSNSTFNIKAVGQDSGNSGMTTYSAGCYGSSGSVTFSIPYNMRGVINLYVNSYTNSTINIGSLQVDSR